MQTYSENRLIGDYIDSQMQTNNDSRTRTYNSILRSISRFRRIDTNTNVIEVGSGMGWFHLYCKMKNIKCHSIEISPQLVKQSIKFCRAQGFEPDIVQGNIEDANIGREKYDIAITMSVFEHVEKWRNGLKNLFDSLKPGGLLHFTSTNRFCPLSGEYPLPFYSYFPDRLRYLIRRKIQGPDIMKLGIDFNQFTYYQLRRFFKKIGFSKIYDISSIMETSDIANPGKSKEMLVHLLKSPIKHAILPFLPYTLFVCIK